MAHVHNIIDADAHFIIDPITRAIKNQTPNKVRLIQGDHNCERFSFEMPKLVEGHDMTTCNLVQVHYKNIDASTRAENKGVYEIKDMKVDGNNIVFSWLITENVTKFVGEIEFLIVFKCTRGEVVDYKWHTDINKEISISNGMNNTEEVTEPFPDILGQWKEELFEAGGNAVVNVSVAEANAIEAVQAEGATQVEAVKAEVEEIRTDREQIYINHMSKASGIEGNAEGQCIILGDSANMPFVGLSVCGKSTQKTTKGINLAHFPNGTYLENGANGVVERGVLIISGTPTVEEGIVLTWFGLDLDLTKLTEGTKYYVYDCSAMINYADGTTNYGKEFVYTAEMEQIRLYVQRRVTDYIDGEIVRPMVATESNAEWEPYTGGIPSPNPEFPQEIESVENLNVNILNKNVLSLETYTNSANYASLIDVVDLRAIKKDKTYTLSVWLESEVNSKAYWNNATKVFPYLEFEVKAGLNRYTYTFTALADGIIGEKPINVLNKFPTNDDKVIKATNAQIEEGTEATEYVAHNEQAMQIPYELHGIPVASGGNYTDKDGKQYICDEVDFLKKKYIQRVEETILNVETSVLSLRGEIDGTVYVITKDNNRYIPKSNLLCDRLSMKNTIYSTSVEGIRVEGTENSFGIRFRIKNERLKTVDVAGVKEYLANNPMRVFAPLLEPIETPLTEEELEAYKALCTNYPNTTILNDSNAFMRVKYGIDTKMYIDKKFEELRLALGGE